FTVAKPTRAQRRPLPPLRVRAGLQRVIDSMVGIPAVLLGHRMDVLASNHLARALYFDFDDAPPRDRNMARFIFLDDAARGLYADWEGAARGVVASLRLYAGRHPNDPQLAELIGELSLRDEDFRGWWADHDVFQRSHGTKVYHHPVVGEMTLAYETLTPTGDPDLVLGLSTAQPGSPSEVALRLLDSWSRSVGEVVEERVARHEEQ
ncbi:MAG: transcriptional regulator, partial [Actinomycetes bacterium]